MAKHVFKLLSGLTEISTTLRTIQSSEHCPTVKMATATVIECCLFKEHFYSQALTKKM